jgi:futalosine hydrolase
LSAAPATLVLVPTGLEAERLGLSHAPVEICGFGLARAGVGAMSAIDRHRPDRVVLAGLAGTYDASRAPIGTVVCPALVRCHGIGAGGLSAAELGFADSDEAALHGGDGSVALSVASASGTPQEAAERVAAHPDALIEEMEGYAVALAAISRSISCTMMRGVCNLAGDRDTSAWAIDAALTAVRERLDSMPA